MPDRTIIVLALSCAALVGCGNFCDEYPEACASAAPEPFDLEVLLIDGSGNGVSSAPVLVSSLDGKVVELRLTGQNGQLTTSVAGESYISVFYEADESHVFTALATPDVPKLTFALPAKATNPGADIVVDSDCTSNCNPTTASFSCRGHVEISNEFTTVVGTVPDYVGCAGSTQYDAFLVGYDASGLAVKASSLFGADLSVAALTMPTMTALTSDDRFDFRMTIDNDLPIEASTRSIFVPYEDRPGYAFSDRNKDTADTIRFSLVKEFVPRAQSVFFVSLPESRTVRRQELFDPVPSDVVFGTPDLAVPIRPAMLQMDDPARPRAYWQLDEGPLTDALQLLVAQGTLRWTVTMPADAKGNFSFPELPEELTSYLLADPDDYDVLHIDLDGVAGYEAFAAKPIRDYEGDPGLDDLTIARASR